MRTALGSGHAEGGEENLFTSPNGNILCRAIGEGSRPPRHIPNGAVVVLTPAASGWRRGDRKAFTEILAWAHHQFST